MLAVSFSTCQVQAATAAHQVSARREVYAIGSSGGACAASYVHMDVDIDETVEYVLGCAATARNSLRKALDIPTYVRGAIERFAPENISEHLARSCPTAQLNYITGQPEPSHWQL